MVNAKQKNLAAVVAFSCFYIIYLLTHFSAIGAIFTVCTITYLAVRTCFAMKGTKYGIIDYIGQYFGATVCNSMVVLLFSTGATFNDIKLYGINSGLLWGIIIITIVAVFVLKKLHDEAKKKNIIAYISKYACIGVGAFFLYRALIHWTLPTYIYVILIYVAITVFIEQIYDKYCNKQNSNATFYWCIANVILFGFIEYLYPYQSIEIMNRFSNIAIIHWKWYTVVLTFLLTIAVAVFSYKLDADAKVYPNDMKLFLVTGIDALLIPYALSTYTRFSIAFFIALAVLNIVVFFTNHSGSRYFKIANYSFVKIDAIFIIGSIILSILHCGFLNGWMYSAAILFAGTLCAYLLYKYKSGINGWLLWEFIVVAFGAFMCESVYRSYNSTISYRYIAYVVIIAALVLAIMNVKNPKKFTSNKELKIAVVIFAAIMIFFPARNLGVNYKFIVDNKISQSDDSLSNTVGESKNITVRLKARGKDNTVEKCYYYWDNDLSNVTDVTLNENSEFTIQPSNGLLHIYAEDKFGVSSVAAKWFDFKVLREWRSSGDPAYIGAPVE